MELVLRAVTIYWFIFVIFRFTGKRSLGEITAFDFVLLLIISESVQSALLGDDNSITASLIVISTLFLMDIFSSFLQQKFPSLNKLFEDTPLLLIDEGQPIEKHMEKEHIGLADILLAARRTRGITQMEEIKYAIFERNGNISIIPWESKTLGR